MHRHTNIPDHRLEIHVVVLHQTWGGVGVVVVVVWGGGVEEMAILTTTAKSVTKCEPILLNVFLLWSCKLK